MDIEILKEITISKNIRKAGDVLSVDDSAGKIYISKNYAKEVNSKELTASEIVEIIEKTDSLKGLDTIESKENNREKPRSTVLKAIEKRKTEITN